MLSNEHAFGFGVEEDDEQPAAEADIAVETGCTRVSRKYNLEYD